MLRKSALLGMGITLVLLSTLCGCTVADEERPTPGASDTNGGLPVFDKNDPLILTGKFTGAGGGIFVLSPDGSGLTRLATDVPGVHKHVSWSPDGQSVVFIDETSEKMYIAHLDGTATESVPACETPGCDYPAWSPDGLQIAFSRYYDDAGVTGPASVGIYIVTLGSGDVAEVIRLERPLLADVPRWSPDGRSLVFGVDQLDDAANETGAAIATIPVTGGTPHYLTEFSTFSYAPDWGGSSSEIIFSTEVRQYAKDYSPTESWDIYRIQPDGSGLAKVTDAKPGQQIQSPRWTPDGLSITAYDHSVPGGTIIDPTTGSSKPFVTGGNLSRPQVRPTS